MLLFSTHKYSCEIVVVGLCIGKYIGETDNVHCDVRDLIVYARLAFCMCTLHEILYIDHFEPFVDCLWLKGDWGCGIDVGPGDHLEPFVLGLGLNGDGGCGIDAGQVDYGRGGVV